MEDVAQELPGKLSQDTLYDGDEIQRRLDAAVAALPEKQKVVFILKYFEDKKYSEIAEITGTSEGALKASYHHAVNKVKEMVVQD
jgi:RNA polymerase sigma-70 factor (ECF subfamily)